MDHAPSGATRLCAEHFDRELRKGLFLHRTDAFKAHTSRITGSQDAGLTCNFFLEGSVTARFGDRQFTIGSDKHPVMSAMAVLRTRKASFEQSTRAPKQVRHLLVSVTLEWLDLEGLQALCAKRTNTLACLQHLLVLQWTPGARLAALVRDLFDPAPLLPELLDLHLESRAVEIITETLAVILKAGCEQTCLQGCSRHERVRLTRAREWIAQNLHQPLTVTAIARAAGASASGLQRLFQRVEGQSIFKYIRRRRLEQAHEALRLGRLSVQEAATLAGYADAANFATAFKRQYGQTPSTIRKLAGDRPWASNKVRSIDSLVY